MADAATGVTPLARLQSFWNARYAAADYAYGTAPNAFLVSCLPRLQALRRGAPVLCLADGEGRNGVWLAQQGCAVTALDVAHEGLRKAGQLAARAGVALTTTVADVTTFDLGRERWAAIVSIFLHLPAAPRRALHRRCAAALEPGGVFIFEAYAPEQIARATGGPKELALLPTLAEVEADFADLAEMRVEQAWSGVRPVIEGALHHGDGHVVQLVVRRAN